MARDRIPSRCVSLVCVLADTVADPIRVLNAGNASSTRMDSMLAPVPMKTMGRQRSSAAPRITSAPRPGLEAEDIRRLVVFALFIFVVVPTCARLLGPASANVGS